MIGILETLTNVATSGFIYIFRKIFPTIYKVEQTQFVNDPPAEETLVKVILYYRHGSRAPYIDPGLYNIQTPDWPDGLGELNKAGKKQCFALGKRLRKRYDRILTPHYSRKNIIAKSTCTDRTMMSTSLVLAGMYPPRDYQIWNEELLWHPIPVHIDDSPQKCFTSRRLLYEFLKNRPKEMEEKMELLLNFVQENSGCKLMHPDCPDVELLLLLDTLNFLKLYEIEVPNWATQYYNQHFPTLLEWFKCTYTGSIIQKQLSFTIVGENILNFIDDSRRVMTHCVHDINIILFTLVLGADIDLWPDTTSCIALEFHRLGDEETVKAFYITNSEGPMTQLEMTSGIEPSLTDFKEMLLGLRPDNYEILRNCVPEEMEILNHNAFNMVYTFTN